jgi:2-oxo-4-hydroxy-4-carboxy-5-ureidoimidazoline decarboxylase
VTLPAIEELDALPPGAFAAQMAPLFEGAPRFLARLADARPFGSLGALFARAREIARAMPEAEQLELIDAHPRLGAVPASVSALSYAEQGYDRGVADLATEPAAELERLNAAYEARFGFRYCVFVAGRPRSALLPGFEAALAGERTSEIARALEAVVDIAQDRWHTLATPAGAAHGGTR